NNRIAIDGSYRDFHTDGAMMCPESESVTLNEPNHGVIGTAYLSSAFGYRIQHRLNVRRRAGDNTQDFARRSLLFQGFLEFLEQRDVFNGDDRLICECFEELDLRWSERTNLKTTRRQRSNNFAFVAKGKE